MYTRLLTENFINNLTLPLGNTLYYVHTKLFIKEVETNEQLSENQRCVM